MDLINKKIYLVYVILIVLALSSCSSDDSKIAKLEAITSPNKVSKGIHVVEYGESLYAIAFRYGRDFREIAAINNLDNAYTIKPGQKIYLNRTNYKRYNNKNSKLTAVNKLAHKSDKQLIINTSQPKIQPILKNKVDKNQYVRSVNWSWPIKGKIVKYFSSKSNSTHRLNHGIDIAANNSTSKNNVKAADKGQVVYSGSGLKGYGNLIIIKHNNTYLSAYAYNDRLYVKEGQWVRKDQVIASLGNRGRKLLHFEIRKNGKPVNPLNYLPKVV